VTWMRSLRRRMVYQPPDAIGFWRARAAEPGLLSVMWRNPTYNEHAHRDQWQAILRNLPQQRGAVLDLGCGTGRLSAELARRFDRYVGVDLDTMVTEARRRNPELRAEFVASSVQDYAFPAEEFDLVLSMACLASACQADELRAVAGRVIGATRPGGRILLIDPFHRLPALTRTCRMAPQEVIRIFTSLGAELHEWTSLHFIPSRLLFASGRLTMAPRLTAFAYRAGETVRALAPRRWGDYSVIAMSRLEKNARS
jgi:SAM-dependent methyltransferase